MRPPLKIFMFGYWGWGNATKQLVAATTAVEKADRRPPPYFVDIRVHRDVRADGFHGDRFKKDTGPGNYKWMPTLGNLAVRKDLKEILGDAIHICHPDAASELLDIAYERARHRQRVIFFCSCPSPDGCHRMEVAKLLKKEARRRGRKIEVVEWPGGKPAERSTVVMVTNTTVPSATNPNLYLKRVRPLPLGTYAGLPVGSIVSATIRGEKHEFAVNPARYSKTKRCWYLETLRNEGYVRVPASPKAVHKYRRKYGYEPIASR